MSSGSVNLRENSVYKIRFTKIRSHLQVPENDKYWNACIFFPYGWQRACFSDFLNNSRTRPIFLGAISMGLTELLNAASYKPIQKNIYLAHIKIKFVFKSKKIQKYFNEPKLFISLWYEMKWSDFKFLDQLYLYSVKI